MKRSPRFLFISAPLIHVKDPETGLPKTLVGKGKTYRSKAPKLFPPLSRRQLVRARKARAAIQRALKEQRA